MLFFLFNSVLSISITFSFILHLMCCSYQCTPEDDTTLEREGIRVKSVLCSCEVVDTAGSRNMGSKLLDVFVPSIAEDVRVLNSTCDRVLANDNPPKPPF